MADKNKLKKLKNAWEFIFVKIGHQHGENAK